MCEDGSHLILVDLKNILLGSFEFVFDGVRCRNMLSLLLAFQFKGEETQCFVLKTKGRSDVKQLTQLSLERDNPKIWYWKNKSYSYGSSEFKDLINRAFRELSFNEGFQNVLLNVERDSLKLLGESEKIKGAFLTRELLISFLLENQKKLLFFHQQLEMLSEGEQNSLN